MDKLNFNTNNIDNLFSGRASWLDNNYDFFAESDKEEVEEVEETKESETEDDDNEELHSDLEDETYDDDDEKDESTETEEEDIEVEEPDEKESNPTEGPDDYDLKDFGNHGGPDVPNNQYNEKDVEILNKLIASESDAINDYFDATTNTVDTNLSRLYGDIGHEERFHLEQLLYAKSLITGEKYEPKDPEVKSEYEELIGQGMDEDTAVITAIDKVSISKPMDDEEFKELEEDVAATESYLMQTEFMTEMILESELYPKLMQEYATRMDIYMEDVLNVNTLSRKEKNGENPIAWMIKQFWNFIKFLRKLGKLVREHLARGRAKRNRVKAFIHKYGISALFKRGYSFYMWDDKNGQFNPSDMIVTADLLYRTTEKIASNCGLQITANNPISPYLRNRTPLTVGSSDQGVKLINGMLLVKSKVLVNDNNEDVITDFLFGYTGDAKYTRYTAGDNDENGNPTYNTTQLSMNFYNTATMILDAITIASQYSNQVLQALQNMEGDPSSIYRRNYDTWKKSVAQMGDVMKGYSKIIKAINSDINTMTKIDNDVIELTNQHDADDQAGRRYEGDTRYFNSEKNKPTENNTSSTNPPIPSVVRRTR